MTTYYGRAVEDPAIVAAVAKLLATEWDPAGCIRQALGSGAAFYREQALVVLGMLAADARETEVAGVLRRLEHEALGESVHPAERRAAIATTAWRLARSL